MRAVKALFFSSSDGKDVQLVPVGPRRCICFEAPFGVRRGGKWVRKLFVFSILEHFLFLFLNKRFSWLQDICLCQLTSLKEVI